MGVAAGDRVSGWGHAQRDGTGGSGEDFGLDSRPAVEGSDHRGSAGKRHGGAGARVGGRGHYASQPGGAIVRRGRNSPHGTQTYGGNGRARDAAAGGARHWQRQHRPDRGASGADGGELGRIAELDRATFAAARFGLHVGSGRRLAVGQGNAPRRRALRCGGRAGGRRGGRLLRDGGGTAGGAGHRPLRNLQFRPAGMGIGS